MKNHNWEGGSPDRQKADRSLIKRLVTKSAVGFGGIELKAEAGGAKMGETRRQKRAASDRGCDQKDPRKET